MIDETKLYDLPVLTEDKLRELEKLCVLENGSINDVIVKRYYECSRRLLDCGYDSRHHIAVAFSYFKKLKCHNDCHK
jgi:hypothetical protein